MAIYTQARRRGQMLSNRRNVTGGPKPPVPGQTPPILRPNQMPAAPTGVNAQGYSPIHYGQNNQQIGYAKVGQARNQGETGVGVPGGSGLTGLAAQLAAGNLPDRFSGGFKIGENTGKIIDTTVGMSNAAHSAQYQKLYNAAMAAGLNITGGSGEGGAYNPKVLYAQPNRYVDMRTGLANPPSTGASADAGTMVSPELLAKLQAKSGYTGAAAQATGNSNAVGLNAAGIASNWQLGSDGQYHDINAPLPPGVDLKPPEGATAPLTSPIALAAEAGHGTPQAAINVGKDPTKHQAYWADKGWVYNEATDQWTNKNAAATPSGGGITPGAGATVPAQAGAASPQMPLDPAYIAAQRGAQLQLNSTLQGVDPALEQINAQNQLALARMGTNAGVDTQNLMENLASRGALQSSIYGTERGNLATNYMRMGQDLAADVANAQSQVYQTQQSAYNDYYQSLIEALLGAQDRAETSSYTPVNYPKRKPKNKNKGKGGRRG